MSFAPPSLPADVLARPALARRLGPAMSAGLTLITGPPGAGKTTLARLWIEQLGERWAWLTIDASLGRRERFWPAFVRALRMASPEFVLDAADAIGDDDVDGELVSQAVVDDLMRAPASGPVVVVIDDAHLIDGETWRDLEWVINHQPNALHLLLASRADPPFPIARLRSMGRVSEVRQNDLAFTREETGELVLRRVGSGAPAELADTLHLRTEGWAAGIRLALMTVSADVAHDTILTRRDEAHGFVSELLISEGLDRLPDDVRQFLTLTSVTPLLEPRLCDALTGRSDSREVLRRLARAHVFVTTLQGQADRYRFHPLFADLLRAELQASEPGAEARQHQLAARWYESEGRYTQAVEHAVAGDLHDTVLELIVGHLGDLLKDGQRQAVLRWLLGLPDSFLRDDPQRAVDHCASLLFISRPEWARWLPRARAVVGDERADLLARLELLEAFTFNGRGYLDEFERQAAKATSLRPPGFEDPWDEVVDAWRVRLLILHGDSATAFDIARRLDHRPRRLVRDLFTRSLVAVAAFAAGDPRGADLVADSINEWRSIGEPDVLGMVDALCVGSGLALASGDIDEAENLAAGAVALGSQRPIHLLGVRAEIALADVEAASGRPEASRARLDEVRRCIDEIDVHPAITALVDAARPGDAAVHPPPSSVAPLVEPLTEREVVILGQLAGHRTYPEIARELFISRHTVKTHVSRIYRKLGVEGRSGAVEAAAARGLLTT